ncbi:HMG box-containing protein 1-like isoform X1 [Schistocerca cancellata]|uniref:HMG box-containing protein 1-like isoform X1 n=2 Tax=Schistocerca cancellata TaxID=274614 RepID=UPI0021173044|nr:HMG box-containing protein 1-like isoform X1 [Schistocerca cancellata]
MYKMMMSDNCTCGNSGEVGKCVRCTSPVQPTDLSLKCPSKKLRPIPPPLDLAGHPPNALKEFAIIATSPKSPLMQKSLPFRKRAYSFSWNSDVTPPPTPPQQPAQAIITATTVKVEPPASPSTQQAQSSVLMSPASLTSSREDLHSCPWPAPVWHCFQPGTLVRFSGDTTWRRAEEISGYRCEWLRLEMAAEQERTQDGVSTVLAFRWERGDLTARCSRLQTFYTHHKGWCAVCPDEVLHAYSVSCHLLEPGDICLPPPRNSCASVGSSWPAVTVKSPDICDSFRRFSFPPEELPTSRHKLVSLKPVPVPSIAVEISTPVPSPAAGPETERAKRPMNAFMLFAKRYRLELIQSHPGKDNRAISVLLGEAWRSMPAEERQKFVEEARLLAQEQKRRHPDCWKRKRSLSTS